MIFEASGVNLKMIFVRKSVCLIVTTCCLIAALRTVEAFSISPLSQRHEFVNFLAHSSQGVPASLGLGTNRRHFSIEMSKDDTEYALKLIPVNKEDIPIAFIDRSSSTFIDCYADAMAIVGEEEYTIGSPCDNSVALCYSDDEDELVPIELDEDLMDKIFPVAARIIEEEFGEELTLARTPQTLTLMGELEEGDSDEERDLGANDDDEEDVELLVAFEHEGRGYNLVRLIDPVLLVGRNTRNDDSKCYLLSPEEADEVMPLLEEMFLQHPLNPPNSN